jgi:GNAT superfamily N-acetyltransferase
MLHVRQHADAGVLAAQALVPGHSTSAKNMNIRLLTTPQDIGDSFPVMSELRPHLTPEMFTAATDRMQKDGYRLVGLFDPDLRAVAGYRKMEMLATGTVLYVDDLVTGAAHRSKGYGQALLQWLLEEAKKQDCAYLELDSGLKRLDAHRFYERYGLEKVAFHFSIPANAEKAWTVKL